MQAAAFNLNPAPVVEPPPFRERLPNGDLRVNYHAGQIRALYSQSRFIGVIAGTQGGKALAVTTEIPTPSGFVLMRDIELGDEVFDEHGAPCRVTYVSPVYVGNDCFRVTFDDGSTVVADAAHLWVTQTRAQRRQAERRADRCISHSTLTTLDIAATLTTRSGHRNHSVDILNINDAPPPSLPVPPYTLGAWLGDGTSSCAGITTADPEVLAEIRAEGVSVGEPKDCNGGLSSSFRLGGSNQRGGSVEKKAATLQGRLRSLGVLNDKHIPDSYLLADVPQRLALLQGLMDTDGHCTKEGKCEWISSSKRLAKDFCALVRSFGIKTRVNVKVTSYKGRKGIAYAVRFVTRLQVFRLPRKAARILTTPVRADARRRYVVSVEPVESVAVRCIAVDSPSHLYLCTRAFIATHNTSFAPHWLLREIHLRGTGDYMLVTPTFKLLELKALKEFRLVFEQLYNLGNYYVTPVRRFVFSFKGMEYVHGIGNFDPRNPTTVYFGYADDPDSLESATIKGAVLDECGQRRFRQQSFEAMMRRGAINQARLLLTTTPYDLSWLYSQIYLRYRDEVQAGKFKSAERTFDIVNFPSVANPAFPHAEDAHARRTLPRWKYLMFYRGKFVKPAGLIYDVFDDRLAPLGKVVPRAAVPAHFLKTLTLDFGAPNFAGVIIATNPLDWRHEVVDEYWPNETRTAAEHYNSLTRDGARSFKYVIGGALSETQWRAELYAAGFKGIEPSPVRLVEVGIDRVYGAFKDDRLYVQEHCRRLRNDLTGYSRELDDQGQPTLKIADKAKYHFADALRYGMSKLEGHELSEWSAEDMQALDPDAGYAEPLGDDDADEYAGTRVRRKLGKRRGDDEY